MLAAYIMYGGAAIAWRRPVFAMTHHTLVWSAPDPSRPWPSSTTLTPDPDVIAHAGVLLRSLDRATQALTDALDVTGFPENERQSEVAMLNTLASGLPPITLQDLVEALHVLAVISGPNALFPGANADLSLPDEARELLYLLEPLSALAVANGRLPKYAGARLRAAPLAFSLSQPKTDAALDAVADVLRQLMGLPLQHPKLTTIRKRGAAESTRAASFIMLLMLVAVVAALILVLSLATGGPFQLR